MTRKHSYGIETSTHRDVIQRRGVRWSNSSQTACLRDATLEDAPLHVLLAEDDHYMRAMVANALRAEGFDVTEVENGTSLLERIGTRLLYGNETTPVDLIISDVRMPGWDGLNVLASLRQADWAIPMILITAFGDPELHSEAHRLGAAAVLDKPLSLRHLRNLAHEVV